MNYITIQSINCSLRGRSKIGVSVICAKRSKLGTVRACFPLFQFLLNMNIFDSVTKVVSSSGGNAGLAVANSGRVLGMDVEVCVGQFVHVIYLSTLHRTAPCYF